MPKIDSFLLRIIDLQRTTHSMGYTDGFSQ